MELEREESEEERTTDSEVELEEESYREERQRRERGWLQALERSLASAAEDIEGGHNHDAAAAPDRSSLARRKEEERVKQRLLKWADANKQGYGIEWPRYSNVDECNRKWNKLNNFMGNWWAKFSAETRRKGIRRASLHKLGLRTLRTAVFNRSKIKWPRIRGLTLDNPEEMQNWIRKVQEGRERKEDNMTAWTQRIVMRSIITCYEGRAGEKAFQEEARRELREFYRNCELSTFNDWIRAQENEEWSIQRAYDEVEAALRPYPNSEEWGREKKRQGEKKRAKNRKRKETKARRRKEGRRAKQSQHECKRTRRDSGGRGRQARREK